MRDTDRNNGTTGADAQDASRHWGRRDVVKTAGALGALSLVPTSVAADRGSSVKEIGIGDEFYQLLEAGKTDQAFDLLEEHNVEYTRSTDYLSSNDGLSTEDYYEKGNSSATFYTSEWDASQDQYAIGVGWSVENKNNDFGGPAPMDPAVLAFEDDVFGYVDDSARASGKVADYLGRPSTRGVTSILSEPGSPEPGAPSNALVAEFNDDRREHDLDGDGVNDFYPTGNGVIQMVVRKQNTSTQGIVAGLYTHTFSFLNIGDYSIIDNLSVDIPGTGISVGVPWGVNKWDLPNHDDRDEDI
jgi:hypothetical protein